MVPADLANTLRNVVNELEIFLGSTEEEFLRLGASLHDFQQRACDITSMAKVVVGLVDSDEIVNGIKSLEQMIGMMDCNQKSSIEKSEKSFIKLRNIIEILDKVDEPLIGFRKINKVLHMLGISTRIESTRLSNGAEGFDNLANDVQELYVQINEKASIVKDRKRELISTVKNTIDRIISIDLGQRAEARTMFDRASSGLSVLVEVNSKCSGVASIISNSSNEVSNNIAEIVTLMQFHDITRQQMEHVAEAISELCNKIEKQAGFIDPGTFTWNEMLVETLTVCELQTAQLGHASLELSGALENILGNLQGVAQMEGQISLEAKEMAGAADKAGSSFFQQMERNLSGVTELLQRSASENRNILSALERLDNIIEEISSLVESIEAIGGEIELIAINAQIKAARTGKEGGALGILAESIQRLSLDARFQTSAISELLGNITKASKELCKDVYSESSSLENDVTEIGKSIGELLQVLRDMNCRFVSYLERLDCSVGSLNMDIESATAAITTHQRVKTVIGKLVNNLEEIILSIQGTSPTLASATSASVKDISGRYTMHSERKIHENMMSLNSKSENRLKSYLHSPQTAASGEFGDNIELF